MARQSNQIIIKRIKKNKHGARHGGHWKVAYADFMTAMMAFFLLLWILSVSEENKLEGIAQFFTPTENIAGQPGGEGILQGSAVAPDQNVLSDPAEPDQAEAGADNPWAKLAEEAKRDEATEAPLGEALEKAGQQFLTQVRDQATLSNLSGNLLVRQIEGQLVVDIFDLGDISMFAAGISEPSENLNLLLKALAPTIVALPHPIRITGHSDKVSEQGLGDNWQISGERAQAVRKLLVAEGLDNTRFVLIAGAADTRPLDPLILDDPRNRRVTIELGSALDE